jgi:chaperonin GroES
MAVNFRPLHDRVIVQRLDEEERSGGGIIIPDSAKEKPQHAKVIRTGNGRRLDDGSIVPLDVKEGDKILFGKYSGSEVKMDGEDYLILREEEILAVIE